MPQIKYRKQNPEPPAEQSAGGFLYPEVLCIETLHGIEYNRGREYKKERLL